MLRHLFPGLTRGRSSSGEALTAALIYNLAAYVLVFLGNIMLKQPKMPAHGVPRPAPVTMQIRPSHMPATSHVPLVGDVGAILAAAPPRGSSR